MNDIPVTWRDRLACSEPGCSKYREVLSSVVQITAEDDAELPLLRILAEVAALVLDPDDSQRPLRPMFPGASRDVVQFDAAALDAMKSVAVDLPVDLRARVRDVLWITRRGAEIDGTQKMIADYCDAAEVLAGGGASSWDTPRSRFRRAIGVAAMMRWKEGLVLARDRVRTFMRDASRDTASRVHMAELAAQWDESDAREAAEIAETAAEAAVAAIGSEPASWDWPRYALEVAADARRRARQPEEAQRLRLRRAELFLLQERWLEGREGVAPMLRATVLEWALTAYLDAGAPVEIVDPVRARLREVQRLTVASMKRSHGPSIDLTESANDAVERVRGKRFGDAVRALVGMRAAPRVESLRRRARDARAQFPLSHLFPKRTIDRDGRTVAASPGTPTDATDEELEPSMFEHARMHQQVLVHGVIHPARQQILSEHPGARHDWVVFLRECPLVDSRRRHAVASGLAAGLHGDLLTSISILTPQLEHMIRTLVASTDGA